MDWSNPDDVRAYNRAYQRTWSKKNPEKVRARNRTPRAIAYAREWQRQWRLQNPEQARAKNRKKRLENPEQARADRRRAYLKHREKEIQGNRKWKEANKERIRQYKKAYNAANRDKILAARRRRYQKTHDVRRVKQHEQCQPQSARKKAIQAQQRARNAGAMPQYLTRSQWDTIKAHYRFRCVYCGKKSQRLTQDHITPLSKGGEHTLANVVPACLRCNCSKKAGPPLSPIQPLLIL